MTAVAQIAAATEARKEKLGWSGGVIDRYAITSKAVGCHEDKIIVHANGSSSAPEVEDDTLRFRKNRAPKLKPIR